MDFNHSIAQGQRVLKQRNALAVIAALLGLLVVVLMVVGATRDREVVLQPIMRSPLTISSAGVSPEYLELVTRDTVLMTLNRSPENLEYWMNSVLAVAAPESHGALKRDLLRIVEEQRGSSVSQFFTIERLKVDPDSLVSEVSGVLHTVVASKEVTAEQKRFRFTWQYEGLSLRLKGFGMVSLKDDEKAPS